MIEARVPELIDGGYWYCEPVPGSVVDGTQQYQANENLKTAKGLTWFVQVGADYYALHRLLSPVTIIAAAGHGTLIKAMDAIGHTPRGRVNGR